MTRRSSLLVLLLAAVPTPACKDAPSSSAALGGTPADPVAPSAVGDGGCNAADQTFAACAELDLTAVLTALTPAVSSLTRIAAAAPAGDLLYASAVYATSSDSTVVEIDLTDPMNPVARDLLPVAALDALVSSILGVASQGELGELVVLDATTVVAVELTSNTLVAVGRGMPGSLQRFAGRGAAAGGFFDGDASRAMFSFDDESQLCATADGRLFVADTNNNALRVLFGNPLFEPSSFVLTLGGMGPAGAGFADGSLTAAMFDAPTGLVATCADQLLLTERGDGGAGHRVRRVTLFGFDPGLGLITGEVTTCAGDGTAASVEGDGVLAQVAEPSAPQSSEGGEVYWIDAATGALRRKSGPANTVDCPLSACAVPSTACSLAGDFTPGASFSTAVTAAGDLYALESGTTLLRRF